MAIVRLAFIIPRMLSALDVLVAQRLSSIPDSCFSLCTWPAPAKAAADAYVGLRRKGENDMGNLVLAVRETGAAREEGGQH